MIEIREEQPGDELRIRELNDLAFGQPDEGEIVDRVRQSCGDLLSLVALEGGEILGHILFSPASVQGNGRRVGGMGLAPMAVHPDHQRRGIGGKLVRAGIERLDGRRCPFVIVLGHARYYPRFGFEPASKHGIRCEWDVPDDVFMIRILDSSEMKGVSGIARYRPEFSQ